MIGLLFLAAGIAVLVILYKRNEYRGFDEYQKAYTQFYGDYYDKKRKEFSWLDNWIKANGDPVIKWAAVNTDKDTKGSSMSPVLLSFAILAVGGIITLIVGSSSVVVFIIVGLITLAGSYLAGNKLGNKAVNADTEHLESPSAYEPYNGLTLECPSCHCPHSWGMTNEEITVERKETKKETTTRTRTVKGGGTDWGFGKGDSTSVSSSTWVTDTYYGKEIRDLKCLNCGHTEHKEYDDVVIGTDSYSEKDSRRNPPESGTKKYNPPETAWAVWLKKENQSASANQDFTDKTPEEKAAAIDNIVELGGVDVLYKSAQNTSDIATSLALYQKAAEMGHAGAQYWLGYFYFEDGSQHVAVDNAKSAMWYEKALNSDSSMYELDVVEKGEIYNRLGEMYRDGNGVPKDIEKAKNYFNKAVEDCDDEDAKKALKELKNLK